MKGRGTKGCGIILGLALMAGKAKITEDLLRLAREQCPDDEEAQKALIQSMGDLLRRSSESSLKRSDARRRRVVGEMSQESVEDLHAEVMPTNARAASPTRAYERSAFVSSDSLGSLDESGVSQEAERRHARELYDMQEKNCELVAQVKHLNAELRRAQAERERSEKALREERDDWMRQFEDTDGELRRSREAAEKLRQDSRRNSLDVSELQSFSSSFDFDFESERLTPVQRRSPHSSKIPRRRAKDDDTLPDDDAAVLKRDAKELELMAKIEELSRRVSELAAQNEELAEKLADQSFNSLDIPVSDLLNSGEVDDAVNDDHLGEEAVNDVASLADETSPDQSKADVAPRISPAEASRLHSKWLEFYSPLFSRRADSDSDGDNALEGLVVVQTDRGEVETVYVMSEEDRAKLMQAQDLARHREAERVAMELERNAARASEEVALEKAAEAARAEDEARRALAATEKDAMEALDVAVAATREGAATAERAREVADLLDRALEALAARRPPSRRAARQERQPEAPALALALFVVFAIWAALRYLVLPFVGHTVPAPS